MRSELCCVLVFVASFWPLKPNRIQVLLGAEVNSSVREGDQQVEQQVRDGWPNVVHAALRLEERWKEATTLRNQSIIGVVICDQQKKQEPNVFGL
eukprot:SAG31_NODE_37438_length_304_cov_0.775610_1_plen_94_part_01